MTYTGVDHLCVRPYGSQPSVSFQARHFVEPEKIHNFFFDKIFSVFGAVNSRAKTTISFKTQYLRAFLGTFNYSLNLNV